jgi:hypothetical protein
VAAAFGTAEFDFKQRGRIFQCLHQRVLSGDGLVLRILIVTRASPDADSSN